MFKEVQPKVKVIVEKEYTAEELAEMEQAKKEAEQAAQNQPAE